MERGAQIGQGLIAFRGCVRTNTSEQSCNKGRCGCINVQQKSVVGRCMRGIKCQWRSIKGYSEVVNCNREALHDDNATLNDNLGALNYINGNGKVLKDDEETLNGDEEVFNGD